MRGAIEPEARPTCAACGRARSVCVCAEIVRVESRARLVIVQDAEEAKNHVGTARMAHLSLPGSVLLEGEDFANDARLAAELGEPGREAFLLWPSAGALPLERIEPRGTPVLVLVDATWPRARQIVNGTPALRALPRVALPATGRRSRYRIRRQPRRDCLSTIEAAAQALGVVERDPEKFRPILRAFERMVDLQVERAAAEGRSILLDPRGERARRPLDPGLAGDLGRVVLVHGETVYHHGAAGERVPELVQWQALRVGTGEVLDLLARPRREVPERAVAYLGFGMADLERALGPEEIREAWSRFARPDDVRASWGYFATNVFRELTGERPRPIDLREATKRVVVRTVRFPEDALLELDVPAPAPLARGRGGRRLAALRSILLELREGRSGRIAT